jgi:hypothetical protein
MDGWIEGRMDGWMEKKGNGLTSEIFGIKTPEVKLAGCSLELDSFLWEHRFSSAGERRFTHSG